jgi:plastocyanin
VRSRSSSALLVLGVALLAGCGSSHNVATTTIATTTAAVPPAAPTTTTRLPPRTISVDEYEFGFTLSQQTISAGKVTFQMRNIGSLMHNFDLIGELDGPFLVPGQTSTITVTLKPGTYTYVCSVKYHAAEGMQGTLTVT